MKKAKKAVKRDAPKKVAKTVRKVRTGPTMEEVVAQPGGKELAKHSQKLRAKIDKAKAKLEPKPEEPKIEVSVRSIYHDGQYLPCLCFRKPGGLHVPCVCGDPVNGVRKFTVNVMQHDKSVVLQHGYGNFAAAYTPERFADHMRRIASTAPISPEARALLLPYAPDMPTGPAAPGLPAAPDAAQPVARAIASRTGARAQPTGPGRTSGKELIRTLSEQSKLPPEKVRAKLRAAGMRAPYVNEGECRKALGLK